MEESSPPKVTAQVSSVMELSMANTSDLNALDLKNPFVTVQVDSNRINQTFTAILDALQNVRVVVSNLSSTVEGTKQNIADVRSDLSAFKQAWETDPRIQELNEKSQAHNDRISTFEEQLSMLKQRMEKNEHRMAQQESKSVDIGPLEKQVKTLQESVGELDTTTVYMRATQDGHTETLTKMNRTVAQTEKQSAELDELVKGLYTVLEMSTQSVLHLAKDPKQSKLKREDTRMTGLTEYVMSLPAFRTMHADFQEELGSMSTRLNDEIQGQKKKLAEESVHLRAKLGEKLDERRFIPVIKDVEALGKRMADLEPRMDKLVDELDTKAALATVTKMHDHLDQVKADKGDLVGLLHRDDLIPLERDIQQLAEAIDRSGAKLKLDIENRSKPSQGTPDLSMLRRSSADDKALNTKIASLEGGVQTIQEDYCRKGDLGDVYVYVDNNLAKIQTQIKSMPTGTTPVEYIAPSATPGLSDSASQPISRPTSGKKRTLAPLMRPISAGHTRASTPPNVNNASIPETIRSPSPPINYTSSPAKYVPNPAKYRATASLFDSDGRRTTASVTAANVPIVDHWNNVARAAAGEEVVPPSHKVHSMA